MKIPRNIGGPEFVKALARYGSRVTRQTGGTPSDGSIPRIASGRHLKCHCG